MYFDIGMCDLIQIWANKNGKYRNEVYTSKIGRRKTRFRNFLECLVDHQTNTNTFTFFICTKKTTPKPNWNYSYSTYLFQLEDPFTSAHFWTFSDPPTYPTSAWIVLNVSTICHFFWSHTPAEMPHRPKRWGGGHVVIWRA